MKIEDFCKSVGEGGGEECEHLNVTVTISRM